ncbi:MAG TPA: hypothetical protein VMG55_14985 [Stellaceae bacterium]|nr:hypothetical protein [Stellaceae bacterium]
MADPSYTFRLSQFQKEATYRATESALFCTIDGKETSLPLAEIRSLRVYDSPSMGFASALVAPGFRRCVIRPRHGRTIVLSSNHFESFGRFRDRHQSFDPFLDTLLRRIAAANPTAEFWAGMPMGLWLFWIVTLIGVVVVTPLLVLLIVMAAMGKIEIAFPAVIAGVLLLGILFRFRSYLRALRAGRSRRFDPKLGLAGIG